MEIEKICLDERCLPRDLLDGTKNMITISTQYDDWYFRYPLVLLDSVEIASISTIYFHSILQLPFSLLHSPTTFVQLFVNVN